MKRIYKYLTDTLLAGGLALLFLFPFAGTSSAFSQNNNDSPVPDTTLHSADTIEIDEVDLPWDFQPDDNNPLTADPESPLFGKDPDNINSQIEYDPETDSYVFKKTLGDSLELGTPYSLPFQDYMQYDFEKGMQDYWRQRVENANFETRSSLIPKLEVGGEAFDRIFGSNTIDIKPQGSAELSFGLNISKVENPNLPVKLQRTTTFDFDEKIQMNVVGQIGDKMKLNVQYDTEASFDFENSVKIEYTGHEDEIIQKIEAGNVSLPLTGSLIQGSQSLFGFKTELKFGKLTMTSIFSQQKGETSTITVEGGAQRQDFEIDADEYEKDKHFFLAHYFKENYDKSLENLPVINSGVNITKVEVWITNTSGNFEDARNIVAFTDLAESNDENIQSDYITGISQTMLPNDSVNSLFNIEEQYPLVRDINQTTSLLSGEPFSMQGGVDYQKIESARKLDASEYTLNSQLGYISLDSRLQSDQVLAVAFEYTVGGETYRVGEFANSGVSAPDALIVKLIKGTSLTPDQTTWDLMMKNIYSIGAYQLSSEDFILDVMYQNDKTGTAINYIPAGDIDKTILLRVMNLDNLNQQLDPYPDGRFDFVNNITIRPENGRVIFPVREPFGSHLRQQITSGDPSLDDVADEYVFQELYDSTQSTARQIAEKNKYYMAGQYKSSSGSEIRLNAINIPEGSVKVTAGGMELTENQDYTVDYNLGRVKIINEGILESGTPINISLESNSMFSVQTKTLVGTHLNYEISKDFNLGATILNLTERPLTQKVSIGDEPISNTIWGVNGSYRSEVPEITKAIDWLPFIETKEQSTITLTGEFAHLIPGHSRAIEKEGNAYIDDFEGSETSIDIKMFNAWSIASTPTGQENLFPYGELMDSLRYGFNRAKLAWYVIDPLFQRNNSPVSVEQQSSHYVREVQEQEIFPNKESETGAIPATLAVLNLAYYPNLKGPYNYNTDELNPDGTLMNPEKRWGGIMRELSTNDFEEANIEYIEFWLMDPFVEDEDNPGGDLLINLGNVSEDVLKDSRKSFENGLPAPAVDNPVDTTVWGLVPRVQSLVNAFDTDPESREAQDVGLDGLSSEDEVEFFADYLSDLAANYGTDSEVYQQAVNDPSLDDYHHFRGEDYDDENIGILERYMDYNGLEGNSPVSQPGEEYSTSATSQPDVEDINEDNTLSENESYFQYRISIRPNEMEIGENYITDKVKHKAEMANDQESEVTWYQFKIPISDYDKAIGRIEDFKSIRFMRMITTNFSQPTIMRFGTLDLVRSDWRKYDKSFIQPGEYIPDELSKTPFEVSAVNIEENANKSPVNYVLPPEIDRVIDPQNPQLRQLNEQAMVLKVIDLADGDARAVYKNIDMDVRKYRKLKMFIHAEEVPGYDLNDDDLEIFVRLGSDYQNNYYEYELPVKVTPAGNYDNDSPDDRLIVWPEENNLELEFDLLQLVKQTRNDEMRSAGSGVTLTRLYSMADGERTVSIMGNPNLSNVRTIMIGVRNPKKQTAADHDDGMEKTAEIWVNELRLTDFDEKGGWAARARMTTKLADFGSITVTGETSKPGFGSIEQKVSERQKEEINSYNISSNLELGKFFPEKSGVRIPMYVSYSESVSNPEYNPLDPDIPFKVALNDPNRPQEEKDSIKRIAQDYTQRKSLNFTNVKVNKMKGQPKIYDLSNWSVSYTYNEIFNRNINTEFDTRKDISGAINYNYNATPQNVEPFKNVSFLNKPSFRLIKDFNFYYLPSQLSFRTNLNRQYNESQTRNINNPYMQIPLNVNKNFNWIRQYDFKYNFSRSLKFDFSATNNARIDEPEGRLWEGDPYYDQKMDTIWTNLRDFGRNTQYNHSLNLNYQLPINKIPILSWVSANARYNGNYDWIAGPITADTIELGNTIQNNNTMSMSSQFNLMSLYNKIDYLKKVNQEYKGRKRRRPQKPEMETVTYTEDVKSLEKEKRKRIVHKLKTENVTVKATNKKGAVVPGDTRIVDDKIVYFTPRKDSDSAKIIVSGQREVKESILKKIVDNTLAMAMSTKNISISYSGTNATSLPGYLPEPQLLGITNYTPDEATFGQQNTIQSPGAPFVLGWQDKNFGRWASDNYLITRDSMLNQPYTMSENETWNIRASLEPVRQMRLDLNLNRTHTVNTSEYYTWTIDDPTTGEGYFKTGTEQIQGNFSMTTITIASAFEPFGQDGNYDSDVFELFASNRKVIAARLAQDRPDYDPSAIDEDGYPEGYGKLSQDVLMPAFRAAYSGMDPKTISLEEFPEITSVLPNWRMTYDGLSQVPFIKDYIRTANITHTYRSTYNIGQYQNNLRDLWDPENGFNYITDSDGNYYSQYTFNSVSITEQFSPLIGIDLNWKNSLITKLEFKKSRNLDMSFSNNQLTEQRTDEYIIGAGYRIKDVQITIGTQGGRKRTFKSDLNLRLDFSIRNNLTVIRKLEEEVNQATAGNGIVTIKASADYVLSDRFNLRLFYDHVINTPKVSISYPTSNIDFGVSVRFTLAS